MLCVACGSYRHVLPNCPDSWENLSRVNIAEEETPAMVMMGSETARAKKKEESVHVVMADDTENVVLFSGNDKQNMAELGIEARNFGVLDCACSSTICGKRWLNCYLDSLDDKDRVKVKEDPSVKVSKFGGGEKLQSLASVEIPAFLAGRDVMIRIDVVDFDIPLFLSVKSMKNAKVKLDLENDTAEILGKNVSLNYTSSGHYCVPIDNLENITVEKVCAVCLHELDRDQQCRAILKLHRQFAHPPEKKLIALLRDASVWSKDFKESLNKIYRECQLCKVYAQTPPRTVVALPMARRFNERVAMDLKKWGSRWILHLVDMWSRLTVSVFIERKKQTDVIDKIMQHWIGAGLGVTEGILSDNGSEFSAEETRKVASLLNLEVCTTAANSPFQNGLCERIHYVTDTMLLMLEEQCPGTPLEVLLCWVNVARNSLQM